MFRRRWMWPVLAVCLGLLSAAASASPQTFSSQPLPELPATLERAALGVHGSTLLVIGGADDALADTSGAASGGGAGRVLVLPAGADMWKSVTYDGDRLPGTAVSTPMGVALVGGVSEGTAKSETTRGASDQVTLFAWTQGKLTTRALPPLPRPANQPPAVAIGSTIYMLFTQPADDDATSPIPEQTHTLFSLDLAADAPVWKAGHSFNSPPLSHVEMASLQETLYVFAQTPSQTSKSPASSSGHTLAGDTVAFGLDTTMPGSQAGWQRIAAPPFWTRGSAAMPYGHSHIFVFNSPAPGTHNDQARNDILAYHTFTDTWVTIGNLRDREPGKPLVAALGQKGIVISGRQVLSAQPQPVPTNYGWLDHSVVALYLLGMIGMGWYFSKRENSTNDYFRGGQRVPWWASGMSLFATGASAISLMAMPGKAYATNWTYLSISAAALFALPIAMFVLAPLVRRLKIATANEYLERRFGLAARLLGSVIYMFTQVAARMASVLLLPAIALAAITGVDVVYCIILMALVTTLYTYLGGLEAVIWTDTIQGFIMIATVSGCLILALVKLDMPFSEMFTLLGSQDKLHTFDFSTSLLYPTLWIFMISTVVGTLGGIGDQNFVQRVQCTPSLKQAKLAVATQLGVAVPINILLFSLGTVLWLFYRAQPEILNPVMKTDGIFPFFAAQQLPVGVSGLVVAALLAATMSTISSSICSVADLGVNDFYRRFNSNATDHSALVLGRVLTAVTGLLGMGAAIFMAQSSMVSVWDLAILVTGLISNGILGLYLLGLLTRRANQWGAMSGVAFGMAAVIYLQMETDITFWLYGFVGSVVTFISGYLLSLALPGEPRELEGLTVFTLRQAAPDPGPHPETLPPPASTQVSSPRHERGRDGPSDTIAIKFHKIMK